MKGKSNIKQTVVDRMVGFVSPEAGLKRLKARTQLALMESYTGSSRRRNSLREFNPSSGDADSDLLFERETLISRSRDLVRNDPIAGGACADFIRNVVGPGLRPHPRIDFKFLGMTEDEADDWENHALREFNLWAETADCDIERNQNFYWKQGLILRQVFENGDVVVLTPRVLRAGNPYSLKLQVIEADRLCNKNNRSNGILENGNRLYDGVEKDRFGAPVRYHISRKHPGSMTIGEKREWDVVKAYGANTHLKNVIHVFDQLRPGQSRGVPFLAPVIEPLKQLKRYTEAELMAAVISGMFTVFIKTETGETDLVPDPGDKDSGRIEDGYKLGNGAIVGLGENESIETANPGRPNSGYDPFVNSIYRQIGVGLGIPYEVLMKCFQSSYSAARAALLDAWRFFKNRRKWMADVFCQVVYEIWMFEAVALGRLSAPGFFSDPLIRRAYLGAEWVGPTQGQIDPVKEISAASQRVDLGISTRQREAMEYSGEDLEKIMPQIRREKRFFADVEKQTGEGNETD